MTRLDVAGLALGSSAVRGASTPPGQRSQLSGAAWSTAEPAPARALDCLTLQTLQPTEQRRDWGVRGAGRGGVPDSAFGGESGCVLLTRGRGEPVCGPGVLCVRPGVRARARRGVRSPVWGPWVWAGALPAPPPRAGDPTPQPAPECRCLQLSRGVAGAGRPLEGGPPAGLPLQWHAMVMWLEDDSSPMRTLEGMRA